MANRHLIDELFNLFIGLTKGYSHVAHVILLTSDSYYIEEVYNNAKLNKTAEFYLLDHLSRKDVEAWLRTEGWGERSDRDAVEKYRRQPLGDRPHARACQKRQKRGAGLPVIVGQMISIRQAQRISPQKTYR